MHILFAFKSKQILTYQYTSKNCLHSYRQRKTYAYTCQCTFVFFTTICVSCYCWAMPTVCEPYECRFLNTRVIVLHMYHFRLSAGRQSTTVHLCFTRVIRQHCGSDIKLNSKI